jgi:hypothetical protein
VTVPGVNVIEFAYKTFAASDFCEHLTLIILGLTLLLGKIMQMHTIRLDIMISFMSQKIYEINLIILKL